VGIRSNEARLASGGFVGGLLGGSLIAATAAIALVVNGGFTTQRTITHFREVLVPSSVSSQREATLSAIYGRDSLGVVLVRTVGVTLPQSTGELLGGQAPQETTALGSGFEIDDAGTVLTNWHVVEGAERITVTLATTATPFSARLVGRDAKNDLAVLRIAPHEITLHPLDLGDSSGLHVGDPVSAIGNPFGYERSLSTGVISGLNRQITTSNGAVIVNALQTDAQINAGGSGGPLLNALGQVVGINSQILAPGEHGGNVGISFAIPINTAKNELSRLEAGARL